MKTDTELVESAKRMGYTPESLETKADQHEATAKAAETEEIKRDFEELADSCRRVAELLRLEKLKADLPTMTVSQVADRVVADWKNVNYAARPYLDAMRSLQTVDDKYYADSGRSVVLYFLSNAASWRGEVARLVKAELNRRVK